MTQKLRKLAEAATQGEWHWDCDEVKGDPFGRVRYQVITSGKTITKIYYSSYEGGPTNAKDDAAYIAAANPAAILELLDRVEKAEKDAARLDWLEKHDKRYYNYDKISCIVGSGFSHGFISEGVNSTLRGAIDSAMEASK